MRAELVQQIDYANKKEEKPQLPSIDAVIAEKCKRSYFCFIQEFWSEIVNDPPSWNWHIPYLAGELTKVLQRVAERKPKEYDLIVNIPPGTTKTLVCSVFMPAWAWARGWWWMRFIKASYAEALSIEHAELTRMVVQSEKYQRLFPNIKIKPDSSAKSHYKIVFRADDSNLWKLGGGLLSTSVGAKVTGFHAHVRLTDDPLDPFSAYSTTVLESTNRWLDQNYSSRVVDKTGTPHILIQQRVHKKDPSGQELKKREKGKRIKHICLPGDIKTKGNKARVSPKQLLKYYKKGNGYLDPDRLSQAAIDELELSLGTYGKKSQIDQNPTAPGSGMFMPENIIILNKDQLYNIEINFVGVVRYWDNAATEDAGAFTCGLKLAKFANGNFIILDIVRGQWATHRREAIKKETTKLDGPTVVVRQEQEPGSGGKDQLIATQSNLKDLGNPFAGDRPTGDKVFRADPVSVAVNRGMLRMAEADWNKDLIEELKDFPNSDYKDITDCLSGAYNYFQNASSVGVW